MIQQTIDIPRIIVLPKGEVTTGFHEFELELGSIKPQPVSRDLLIQALATGEQDTLGGGDSLQHEQRLEDYIVRGLVDFDDISYDDHADLLYALAGQMVEHLRSYLHEDDQVRNVLIYHQNQLVKFIHAQMQEHQWEEATGYEAVTSKGFTELKPSAYSAKDGDVICDFKKPVADKGKIAQMLFGGFKKCLYGVQKFHSDSERKLAIILDRETIKWFRPAKGQFQIFYKSGTSHAEYIPDFVAEAEDCIYLLEPKARNELEADDVLAKKAAALEWCSHATAHNQKNGGKAWKYVLIPHDVIAENMTLDGLENHAG